MYKFVGGGHACMHACVRVVPSYVYVAYARTSIGTHKEHLRLF